MRVIFIGASSFGLSCLSTIIALPSISVVGVLTGPGIFNISYSSKPVQNILHVDFTRWCSDRALPCYEMLTSMHDEALLDQMRVLEPEAFVVAGWYHMIPKSWRDLAPAYGLHASLLPDYSGGAPLVWAMINGESTAGITLFQMDEGVDSGPIVAQSEEPIHDRDTIATLYERIEVKGRALLAEFLPKLAAGDAVCRPQSSKNRRVMPQRSPEDGRIDWTQDSRFIDRFIRAQTRPYPGAFSTLVDKRVTIWAARSIKAEHLHLPPGSICALAEGRAVACGKGALILLEVEVDGRVFTTDNLSVALGERDMNDTAVRFV